MSQDLARLASVIERGDPERFLAVMAAPPDLRARLFAIYAVNLEIARAPYASPEPLVAQMRLQFWADLADALQAGRALPAHEWAAPLAASLPARDAGLLSVLVAARMRDTTKDCFADEAAFSAYIEATGAGLLWMAARSLGAQDMFEPAIRAIGWAMGLANYLRAIPALEEKGHAPLHDGRPSTVAHLARMGLGKLRAARIERGMIPAHVTPALYAAWLAEPILKKAAAHPALVAQGGLEPSEAGKRMRLAYVSLTGRW